MKIFGLIASLLITFFSIGQKSYYFSKPLPSLRNEVRSVDPKLFGTYSSNTIPRSYEFNQNGVYILSTAINSITREVVRESSKYDVRDGFIFGVMENDSLPCVLENERFYFGMLNKEVLVGESSKTVLTRVGKNEYIINFYENGNYTPGVLKFQGSKLILKDFAYEFETDVFNHIANQKSIDTEFHEMIILTPTFEEYELLLKNGIYSSSGSFKKKKKLYQ
jgi:hypothetical protein